VECLLEGASLAGIVAGLLAFVGGLLGVRRARRGSGAPVAPGKPSVTVPAAEHDAPSRPDPEHRAREDRAADEGAPDERASAASDASGSDVPGATGGGRLARTRALLSAALADLVGAGLEDEAWERLEEVLIGADVGVQAATDVIAEVRRQARERGVRDAAGVRTLLGESLVAQLGAGERELGRRDGDGLTVWLVTGVNGAGKTTTIGKLAAREAAAGRRVVLAAADTFRAAAADQLAIWAERTGAQLVRGDEGADPASVAYAGADAAIAAGADLLIVDTAGRLQNRRELMDELGKVSRVLAKRTGGIDETLLVLDGTVGQNGIAQAAAFHEAVQVTGIAITKLDGSSRGGIVVAVQRQLGIPVKLVGLGEGIDDLVAFEPGAYVEDMLDG
jgi:fused signal recognition particle receptor